MLNLCQSPHVLVLGIYGWADGERRGWYQCSRPHRNTYSLHNTMTQAEHTLPFEVSDQGHRPSNPDPYC